MEYKWPLIGNNHIEDLLSGSIKFQKAGGAYIFCGPGGVGKWTTAKFFIRSLLCSRGEGYPCGDCAMCESTRSFDKEDDGENAELLSVQSDISLVKREDGKDLISIGQIRDLESTLSRSSFMNTYKIGVVKDADRMTTEASNAFLKTLEEPRGNTVIILLADNPENILPTIASRSQILRFYPVSKDKIYDYLTNDLSVARDRALSSSHLAANRPALAKKLALDEDFYRQTEEACKKFFELFKNDINGRLDLLSDFFAEREKGGSSVSLASEATDRVRVWQTVIRDLMLYRFGQKEWMRFKLAEDIVEKADSYFSLGHYKRLLERLEECESNIASNVNPKLAMENFVCNLN